MSQTDKGSGPARILVVDDTPSNVRLLMNLLTRHSFVVHPATSGRAALRFLEIALPDLILLDAVMPEMDGYQLCTQLKANARTRDIPVIFISAASQPLDKVRAFGVGAVDYIVKPFQAEEVMARIATHLTLRGLQKHLEQRVAERTAELQAANVRLNAEIAERKRVEAALREREGRIRRLVDSDLIGVYFWDLDCVTDANDAFLRIIGHTVQEMRAKKIFWHDITPPEFLAADRAAIEEARRAGTCTPYEKELLSRDGRRTPVLVGAAMFEGSHDEGVAFVLDLSERRQAEADRQARLAAELSSQAKSIFMASMSHELRTPLNAILGYAQILKRDKRLDQHQRAGLDTIQQSGEHLLTLINDILDLSRIEAGKVELYPQAVDLPAFLKVVADIIRVKAELKDLAFSFEAGPEIPGAVNVDQQRLRQVLLNLLGNAVKFTDRGHIRLLVGAQPAAEGHARLHFEVRDSGPGIPLAQQEIIFQPFEQVGEVRRRFGGTGLGLAISRQLVRLMGSDIAVESAPGQGSRFWFDVTVPLATAAEVRSAPAEKTITGYRGARRKVLVVDDVDANRAMLVDLFNLLGFTVGEASDGQAALERVQALQPDLVVMDVNMPVMNGLEAMARIRALPGGQELPIIAVSAGASPDDRARSLAAGANAFIPKPIVQARLLDEIGTRLGISWICEAAEAAEKRDGDKNVRLVPPPREEIETLYRLARTGNMRDIAEQADRLAALDERYLPFAERLRDLARGYQSKAILAMIGKYRDESRAR